MNTPQGTTTPTYPQFEVQELVEEITLFPNLTPHMERQVRRAEPGETPQFFGLYRYDEPDETGISVANHLGDFGSREVAEAFMKTLLLVGRTDITNILFTH